MSIGRCQPEKKITPFSTILFHFALFSAHRQACKKAFQLPFMMNGIAVVRLKR